MTADVYLQLNNQIIGPITTQALKELIREGRVPGKQPLPPTDRTLIPKAARDFVRIPHANRLQFPEVEPAEASRRSSFGQHAHDLDEGRCTELRAKSDETPERRPRHHRPA